jgi:hypothetical protein
MSKRTYKPLAGPGYEQVRAELDKQDQNLALAQATYDALLGEGAWAKNRMSELWTWSLEQPRLLDEPALVRWVHGHATAALEEREVVA